MKLTVAEGTFFMKSPVAHCAYSIPVKRKIMLQNGAYNVTKFSLRILCLKSYNNVDSHLLKEKDER